MNLHLALVLMHLLAQSGEVQYSNGQITFEHYSLIDYPILNRAAGMECDVKTHLTIAVDGKITLGPMDLQNGRSPSGLDVPSSLFFRPVREAVLAWDLANETTAEVSLPLLVEFRLSGDSGADPPAKNRVVLVPGKLTIRVTAPGRRVIP